MNVHSVPRRASTIIEGQLLFQIAEAAEKARYVELREQYPYGTYHDFYNADAGSEVITARKAFYDWRNKHEWPHDNQYVEEFGAFRIWLR